MTRPRPTHPPALEDVRRALGEVVPRLTALIRAIEEPGAPAVGTWSAIETAAHLAHGFQVDRDAILGAPIPEVAVTGAGIAEGTAKLLREDPERDADRLADRIESLARDLDEAVADAGDEPVSWLGGLALTPPVVMCHALEESLVHGHDIAAAVGRRWEIERRVGVVAVEGWVFPLLSALPPEAFVDQTGDADLRATVELRVRGGGATFLCLRDRQLRLANEVTGRVDGHIDAEPGALMLTFLRRQGILRQVATGKMVAWGRRPWLLPRVLAAMSPP